MLFSTAMSNHQSVALKTIQISSKKWIGLREHLQETIDLSHSIPGHVDPPLDPSTDPTNGKVCRVMAYGVTHFASCKRRVDVDLWISEYMLIRQV